VSDELPVAFRDLPARAYPFVVEYFTTTGAVVHTERVEGPGVMKVPGLSGLFGPIGVRVTYASGEVVETPPP
jgi:hypothetical protein